MITRVMDNTGPVDAGPIFHVAFGVDANYFLGMGVAIVSVLENNRSQSFVFHIFTASIMDDHSAQLREIEKKYRTVILVKLIDPTIFDEFADFTSISQYSAAIFMRLLIAGSLKGIADRVLYLDADIVCQGDLTELMSIELGDNIAAVVGDVGSIAEMQVAKLGLTGGRYFNSGMLYIDVNRWCAENIWHKAVQAILSSDKSFLFPDQDALNKVMDGRVKFIDAKFNWLYDLFAETASKNNPPPNAVFIHFVGRLKPWHSWCCNSAKDIFLKYQALSPWANAPLYGPKNYKEIRMFAQGLLRTGNRMQGILWYIKFIINKFFHI
ncbi:glycosyltransferase family 8 protein [Glaciimonas immobilis]|uniref:UDP-glucose:(Glucosyl)LPS alpha-1,3-glucosyltransferase n=1 Tax=Glaciimonas immobilis TaxID=728004 RepID=A0A840RTH3_9BURK|nr:glycosyltransferase [Glaciimonas immobilis]KAF3999960.1 hypothetical protein HAV38_01935 [Glaciimonas immobilis]MBB5200462.1 UDP-glucose:(glucosyl)LPS alpha-1,3-glucosyltransferase [Glaciimonas immobilis]